MIESILISLLRSLFLTVLVEVVSARLLGLKAGKDLALVVLVNILTNPPLVLLLDILYVFHRGSVHWLLILVLESTVVCVEALLYRGRLQSCRLSPWTLSLLLNGISYFGGWLI